MRSRASVLIGASLAAAVSGCSARSRTTTLEPIAADLGSYKQVVVSVESRVPDEISKERSDLEGLILSKVKALNRYASVQLREAGTQPTPETVFVNVGITHVKKVGGTKRFMLGAMAGRATMTTEIAFEDAVSGRRLGSYTVTGQSGGTGVSGGTSDAVNKAAEAVAGLLGGRGVPAP